MEIQTPNFMRKWKKTGVYKTPVRMLKIEIKEQCYMCTNAKLNKCQNKLI